MPKEEEITDKLDFIKIKNFMLLKTMSRELRQATNWEKIFANDATNKGLISKIYKQFIQLNNNKKPNNPIKKWAEDLNRHSDRCEMISHCGLDLHFPNN